MLKMRISNQIELPLVEVARSLFAAIRKDLTIPNPEYLQAIKQGRDPHGRPEYIELYRIDGESLILPRGYGSLLQRRLKEADVVWTWEDKRLQLPSVEFGSCIQLRDYQRPAVEALVKSRQGGVVAGCGAGKTMIMLETIARVKQPSLWVTHTTELAEQVIQRAVEVFDITEQEIGRLYGGQMTVGERLTVALVQTLTKIDLDVLRGKFGLVAVDEAHHLAARSFFHPIGQFPAMYRVWASATPERADGLTQMVFAGGGPIVHTVDSSVVPTITPRLEVVKTEFYSPSDEYVQIMSDLVDDRHRNDQIVRTIAANARGNYSLVISERVQHLETLRPLITNTVPSLRIEILTGSMSKRARAEVMERVQAKEIDVLMSTQLAREGLDITHLNRLFLVTPKRAAAAIQQEVGRIMRPCSRKTEAVVFDFWDVGHPMLRAQFWRRREVYEKLGMFRPEETARAAR